MPSNVSKLFARFKPNKRSRRQAAYEDGDESPSDPLRDNAPSASPQQGDEKNPSDPLQDNALTAGSQQDNKVAHRKPVWDDAYDRLNELDSELVKKYEEILSRVLEDATAEGKATSTHTEQGSDGGPADVGVGRSPGDDVPPKRYNSAERQQDLQRIIEHGQQLTRMRGKFRIGSREFEFSNATRSAIAVASAAKGFIDEAVKVSSEAALAWAAITLAFNLFQTPFQDATDQANAFLFVSRKMGHYESLGQKIQEIADYKDRMVSLYTGLLKFYLQTVVWLFSSITKRAAKAVINAYDWPGMLKNIEDEDKWLCHELNLTLKMEESDRRKRQEHHKLVESQLPTAATAALRSNIDRKHTDGQPFCYEGTRNKIREDIINRLLRGDDRVFLLKGPAGAGKSVIARTLADEFQRSEQLAASFFFRRGEAGRDSAKLFFTTISCQLILSIPGFEPDLEDLRKRFTGSNITETRIPLVEQFKVLISAPLSKIQHDFDPGRRMVIVVDALDECGDVDDSKEILDLFCDQPDLPGMRWLRVLFTVRPGVLPPMPGLQGFDLADYNKDTQEDISTYLKARLKEISEEHNRNTEWDALPENWPGDHNIKVLVQKATEPTPLFIFAAVVARDLAKSDFKEDRLNDWVELPTFPDSASEENRLVQMYDSVWVQPHRGSQISKEATLLADIIWLIALVERPLPLHALYGLLSWKRSTTLLQRSGMGSVLHIPQRGDTASVEVLHVSFRDYIIYRQNTNKAVGYQISEAAAQKLLVSWCIERMTGDKKKAALNYSSGSSETAPKGIADITAADCNPRFPEDLEYACLHWLRHLLKSGKYQIAESIPDVQQFFNKHLIDWLRCLGLLKGMSTGITAVRELLSILGQPSAPEFQYLRDIEQFMTAYGSTIDHSPDQVCGTALTFCSPQSYVLKQHGHRAQKIFKHKWSRRKWDLCLQTLKGHDDSVNSVAFSKDGRTLASASSDRTIRIWDSITGAHRITITGHAGYVLALAFDPNSDQLISASSDGEICVWDIVTGNRGQNLPRPKPPASGHWIKSIAFSETQSRDQNQTVQPILKLTWTDNTTAEWDSSTNRLEPASVVARITQESPDGFISAKTEGNNIVIEKTFHSSDRTEREELKDHADLVNWIVFVSEAILASGSRDGTVRIWDLDSKKCVRKLECSNGWANFIALCPEFMGNALAAAYSDGTIRIWRIKISGDYEGSEAQSYGSAVNSVAFSPDGKCLASTFINGRLELWDIGSGNRINTLYEGDQDTILAVSWSPDSRTLALGLRSGGVQVWERRVDRLGNLEFLQRRTLQGHSNYVLAIASQGDGKDLRFASASADRSVKIWDPSSDDCCHTFHGHRDWVTAVTFTDYKQLVSASNDGTLRFWDYNKQQTDSEWERETSEEGYADLRKKSPGWVRSISTIPTDEARIFTLTFSDGTERNLDILYSAERSGLAFSVGHSPAPVEWLRKVSPKNHDKEEYKKEDSKGEDPRGSVMNWDYIWERIGFLLNGGSLDWKLNIRILTAVHDRLNIREAADAGHAFGHKKHAGKVLYREMKDFLECHVEKVRHRMEALPKAPTTSDNSMANFYANEWEKYTNFVKWMDRLFRYLDRHWVIIEHDEGNRDIYRVQDLCILTWARSFFPEGESPLSGHIRNLLVQERQNEVENFNPLLERIANYLAELKTEDELQRGGYNRSSFTAPYILDIHFNKLFIEISEGYYQQKSEDFCRELDIYRYLQEAKDFETKEERLIQNRFHQDLKASLTRLFFIKFFADRKEFIEERFMELLRKGYKDEMMLVFRMFSYRWQMLDILQSKYEPYLQSAGLAVVVDAAEPGWKQELKSYSGRVLRSEKLAIKGDWVYVDEERVLFLPPDYSPTCVAFHDGILVLGHRSGHLTFFETEFL